MRVVPERVDDARCPYPKQQQRGGQQDRGGAQRRRGTGPAPNAPHWPGVVEDGRAIIGAHILPASVGPSRAANSSSSASTKIIFISRRGQSRRIQGRSMRTKKI